MKIVIDIETAPLEGCESYLDPVEAPANYKDQDKIDAYIREKTADQVPRCSLDPDLCRIVSVGAWIEAHDDKAYDPWVQSVRSVSESLMIKNMLALLHDYDHVIFVGFNCLSFDLPVLLRRALYLGMPVPTIQIDRFKHPHVTDLLSILSFDGKLKMRSLDWYCRRFGIEVPDPIQGSDIGRLVADGDWAGVESHCCADVRKTGLLAARMGLFQAVPESAEVR